MARIKIGLAHKHSKLTLVFTFDYGLEWRLNNFKAQRCIMSSRVTFQTTSTQRKTTLAKTVDPQTTPNITNHATSLNVK
jgi:hypothetical protein